MNKQELIEKIEALPDNIGLVRPHIDKKMVLGLVRQLDEPQKVVVPQFVADWYEEHKDNLEFNIFDYVYQFDQNAGFDFKDWFDDFNTKPIQTLVNMHQFGYEVEKEKRYLVVMKETKQPLYYNSSDDKLFFSMAKIASHFTRQQLEKFNFGWVFDCEGIEIEEVE